MEAMPNLEEIVLNDEEIQKEDPYIFWDSCRREPEPELFFKRNKKWEKRQTLKNKIRDKRRYLLNSTNNRNKYVETYRGVITTSSKESSYETMIVNYFKKDFVSVCKPKTEIKQFFAEKFGDKICLYDLETKKFFRSFYCNYQNHTLYDNRCCSFGEYIKKVKDLETIKIPAQTNEKYQSFFRRQIGQKRFFFNKPTVKSYDCWSQKVFVKGVSIPIIDFSYKNDSNNYSRNDYKKEISIEEKMFQQEIEDQRYDDDTEIDFEDPSYDDYLEYLEDLEREKAYFLDFDDYDDFDEDYLLDLFEEDDIYFPDNNEIIEPFND